MLPRLRSIDTVLVIFPDFEETSRWLLLVSTVLAWHSAVDSSWIASTCLETSIYRHSCRKFYDGLKRAVPCGRDECDAAPRHVLVSVKPSVITSKPFWAVFAATRHRWQHVKPSSTNSRLRVPPVSRSCRWASSRTQNCTRLEESACLFDGSGRGVVGTMTAVHKKTVTKQRRDKMR